MSQTEQTACVTFTHPAIPFSIGWPGCTAHKTPIVPRFFALYRETKIFLSVNIRATLSHLVEAEVRRLCPSAPQRPVHKLGP